jgi:hypothetical protein
MSSDTNDPRDGTSRREFVLKMAIAGASGAVLGGAGFAASAALRTEERPLGAAAASEVDPLVVRVTPVRLQKGDLLVTDQFNSKVRLVRDGREQPFVDVGTWSKSHLWDAIASTDHKRVYVSLSGIRGPVIDYVGIRGLGAVLEIDPERGELLRTFTSIHPKTGHPYTDRMIDPAGMVLLDEEKALLVNDFNGFKSAGKVLRIDLASGDISVFADGLAEPAGMTRDGRDHVLIANARMPQGAELGGQIVRLNVHSGEKEVLYDMYSSTGALIGAARFSDGKVYATLSDWPAQQTSAFFRVEGVDRATQLYQPKPGFLSAGVATDADGVWIAESVRRRLYKIAPDGKVLATVAVEGGPADEARPPLLERAFDTLESVKTVA